MLTILVGLSKMILFICASGLLGALTAFIGAVIIIIILQIECYGEYKKFCKLTKEDLLELLELETLLSCFFVGLAFYVFIAFCFLIGFLFE